MLTLALALLGSALGGTLAATSASAADDPTDGGLWYYTKLDLATVHQRTTGTGVTVAVLDGLINPAAPDLIGANLTTRPNSFCQDTSGATQPATATDASAEHATDSASLIVGTGAGAGGQPGTLDVAPGANVHHYAVSLADGVPCRPDDMSWLVAGIDQSVADGAKIISISLGYTAMSTGTFDAIARAERARVIVVVASKNRGGPDLGWPASANGVVSVEAADAGGHLNSATVTSPLLSVVAPGETMREISWSEGRWDTYALNRGSSHATAWTSGVHALVWSAYPDASANQIIPGIRPTKVGPFQVTTRRHKFVQPFGL